VDIGAAFAELREKLPGMAEVLEFAGGAVEPGGIGELGGAGRVEVLDESDAEDEAGGRPERKG